MINKPPDSLSERFLQAVENGNQKEAKQLLEAGADINYIDPESGWTALQLAVESLPMIRLDALREAGR
jgi:ankyrin repeat protein